MNVIKLAFLLPAIIALVVGLAVMGYISLDFLISREQLVWFTGLTATIAGLWLGASALFNAIKD